MKEQKTKPSKIVRIEKKLQAKQSKEEKKQRKKIAKAKKSEKTKKMSSMAILVQMAVVIMLIYIGFTIYGIVEIKDQQAVLTKEKDELMQKKAELIYEQENSNTLSYIEQQARSVLKMIKPGEVLFITSTPEKLSTTNQGIESDSTNAKPTP